MASPKLSLAAKLALPVALIPAALYIFRWASGGEFADTISMLTAAYALYYLGVAITKIVNGWRWGQKYPGEKAPASGALLFVLAATALLVIPGIQILHALLVVEPPPHITLEDLNKIHVVAIDPPEHENIMSGAQSWLMVFSIVLLVCNIPWALLLALRRFRHLRRQALRGLSGILFVPLLVVPVLSMAFYPVNKPDQIRACAPDSPECRGGMTFRCMTACADK